MTYPEGWMMHSEEQARKKWCPEARVATGYTVDGKFQTEAQSPAFNRMSNSCKISFPNSARCIASDCMAWRWSGGARHFTEGYCGLAGQPT